MKLKNSGNIVPAKEDIEKMKNIIHKDEIDEIIEIVVRWVQPSRNLSELNDSIFYGLVRTKIEDMIEKMKIPKS